jgi:hypothetical protein
MSTSISSLIAIPSPRDIPMVKKEMDRIHGEGLEKLWIKYHTESDAYAFMEDYFLNQTKADYLVICPDDLVVQQRNYDDLIKTIYDFGGPDKIKVLSGICNINNIPGLGTQMAVCVDSLIHPQRRRRLWHWLDLRESDWRVKGYDKMRLLQVQFSGFACQFIHRDVVQKVGLHGDLQYNELHRQAQDYSFDVIFCWLCAKSEIPIYVNPQVRMLHLRGSDSRKVPGIEPLLVGKQPKRILLVDADGNEKDLTPPPSETPTPTPTPTSSDKNIFKK